MRDVKLFHSLRHIGMKHVVDLAKELEKREIYIYVEPIKADVSIVLFGNYSNPVCLHGKKVLAFDATRWGIYTDTAQGWEMYKPILEEYYDEFIDMTDLTVPARADLLELSINKYRET